MAFDVSRVKEYLPENVAVEYFDLIGSTNTELVRRVKEGAARCSDVIAAGAQSAGRGRRGNSFYSPDGGIYFSFAAKNTDGALPTVTAGVAVADMLARFGYDPEIKWVNDVLIGGKKVCGILAEAVSGTDLCVIGIGINMRADALPAELAGTATSLDIEGRIPPSAEEAVGITVRYFNELCPLSAKKITERYRSYLKFLGEDIEIKNTKEVCRALDVTEHGELKVARRDGSVLTLNSGEISILIER